MKQEHTEAEKTRKNVKEIQQPPHIGSIDTPELAAPTIETCTTERMTALKFKQQPILSSVSLEDLPTHRLIALHPANQENKASTINKPNVGERLAPKSVFFLAILLFILIINSAMNSFPRRDWQRALLYAIFPLWVGLGVFLVLGSAKIGIFYLVTSEHIGANINLLELFASLGILGWLARNLFKPLGS